MSAVQFLKIKSDAPIDNLPKLFAHAVSMETIYTSLQKYTMWKPHSLPM